MVFFTYHFSDMPRSKNFKKVNFLFSGAHCCINLIDKADQNCISLLKPHFIKNLFHFSLLLKQKKKMKVGNVWKKARANKIFSFEKSSLNRSWKQSWSVSSSFPSFSSSCDSSLLFPSFAIGEPQNNLSFA